MNEDIKETAFETEEEITDSLPDIQVEEEKDEPPFPVDEKTEEAEPIEEPNEENELEILKRELDALKRELEEKKSVFERMSRDIGEFSDLFPDKNINSIPDTVWESVRSGIPLAAAYALYERKNAIREGVARRANEENGARTTGSIGKDSTENFYTPDEVRAMSRTEVKNNYSKIIESMKKWN